MNWGVNCVIIGACSIQLFAFLFFSSFFLFFCILVCESVCVLFVLFCLSMFFLYSMDQVAWNKTDDDDDDNNNNNNNNNVGGQTSMGPMVISIRISLSRSSLRATIAELMSSRSLIGLWSLLLTSFMKSKISFMRVLYIALQCLPQERRQARVSALKPCFSRSVAQFPINMSHGSIYP